MHSRPPLFQDILLFFCPWVCHTVLFEYWSGAGGSFRILQRTGKWFRYVIVQNAPPFVVLFHQPEYLLINVSYIYQFSLDIICFEGAHVDPARAGMRKKKLKGAQNTKEILGYKTYAPGEGEEIFSTTPIRVCGHR